MRMTGESPVAMRTRRVVGLDGEREALLIRATLPAEATMPRIVPPFVIHPLPASPFEVATTAAQALCRGCVPSLPVGTLTVGRRRSPRGP